MTLLTRTHHDTHIHLSTCPLAVDATPWNWPDTADPTDVARAAAKYSLIPCDRCHPLHELDRIARAHDLTRQALRDHLQEHHP